MEQIFKFNKFEFLKSKMTDREMHNGLCLTMCVDYIYNKHRNKVCDFIYFSKVWLFSARQRALSYCANSGRVKDAVLRKNGRVVFTFKSYYSSVERIKFLYRGCYIIALSFPNGTGHAMALINDYDMRLFDPNFGEYSIDDISELKGFLSEKYLCIGVYVYTATEFSKR